MKINKDSWHYKVWASSFDQYDGAPENTDLCRYCHRIFWRLALGTFFAVGILFCLSMLGYTIFYKGLFQNTTPTLIIAAVIGVVVGAVYLYTRWLNGSKLQPEEPTTLVGKYLSASKQKVCPLVDFEDK